MTNTEEQSPQRHGKSPPAVRENAVMQSSLWLDSLHFLSVGCLLVLKERRISFFKNLKINIESFLHCMRNIIVNITSLCIHEMLIIKDIYHNAQKSRH